MTHELQPSVSLVIPIDPDFSADYHVGREFYFFEATPEEQYPTDTYLIETIHNWALGYPEWQEPEEVLRYVLGCRIGAFSARLIPMMIPATAS